MLSFFNVEKVVSKNEIQMLVVVKGAWHGLYDR